MRGKTGGFKDIRNQDTAGTYENREMFGQESLRSAYVIFDLEAPFHCTEGITGYLCEHENTKPVEFDLDITSVTYSFSDCLIIAMLFFDAP